MNLTLSIPDKLKAKMSRFPDMNWSEVARQAIAEKVRVLEQMQQLLSRSTLTELNALTIGREIKRRMWKKSRLSKRQTFDALVRRSRRYAKQAALRKSSLTKGLRTVRHQAVLKELLKQPGFRQGYARELRKLAKLAQEPGGKTFSSMEGLLRDLKRR